MKIVVCMVKGFGYIVGEVIDSSKNRILFKNPAILLVRKEGHFFVEPVPDFFEDKESMMQKFRVDRYNILISSKPTKVTIDGYLKYVESLSYRRSNLIPLGQTMH